MGILTINRTDGNGFYLPVRQAEWSGHDYSNTVVYDFDAGTKGADFLGLGVSITDASGAVLAGLPQEKRYGILRRVFGADGLNLSVARLNVGSSDYASGVYSYDDVPDDFKLEHFSIERDLRYLIPVIREALAVNPELFLFSSPWSPPGWMKTGNSMLGGFLRSDRLEAFADYYVRYLAEYALCGVNIRALTCQNESETDQNCKMPASYLHPQFEMELVAKLLPERLKKAGLDVKLWLCDHNYDLWNRVAWQLDDPQVKQAADAVAFHPYCGRIEMVDCFLERHPGTAWHMTECGPALGDRYASDCTRWIRMISEVFNHGGSSFTGWNLALDENGDPNVGPFHCGGLLTVHSQTGEVSYSGQYRAFRHFAPVRRGAAVMTHTVRGAENPDVSVTAFSDGNRRCFIIGNGGMETGYLQLKHRGRYLRLALPPESALTVEDED